jgi:hypothetical protein
MESKSVGKDIDDIPFADDSEDDMLDEKFYTPKTSVKNKLDNKKEIQNKDIRKRILPVPPMQCEKPTSPSADHIRELKKVEMNRNIINIFPNTFAFHLFQVWTNLFF